MLCYSKLIAMLDWHGWVRFGVPTLAGSFSFPPRHTCRASAAAEEVSLVRSPSIPGGTKLSKLSPPGGCKFGSQNVPNCACCRMASSFRAASVPRQKSLLTAGASEDGSGPCEVSRLRAETKVCPGLQLSPEPVELGLCSIQLLHGLHSTKDRQAEITETSNTPE